MDLNRYLYVKIIKYLSTDIHRYNVDYSCCTSFIYMLHLQYIVKKIHARWLEIF
jgi:hypothetical protein